MTNTRVLLRMAPDVFRVLHCIRMAPLMQDVGSVGRMGTPTPTLGGELPSYPHYPHRRHCLRVCRTGYRPITLPKVLDFDRRIAGGRRMAGGLVRAMAPEAGPAGSSRQCLRHCRGLLKAMPWHCLEQAPTGPASGVRYRGTSLIPKKNDLFAVKFNCMGT